MSTQTLNKKLPEDWPTDAIKSALNNAGWSLYRLSLHHGYNRTTLGHALRRPYPNAERIIAEAIGTAPEKIWPSRYDHRRPLRGKGGAPTHNKKHRKFTTPTPLRNVNQSEGV